MDALRQSVDSEESSRQGEIQAVATGAGTTACDGSDQLKGSIS